LQLRLRHKRLVGVCFVRIRCIVSATTASFGSVAGQYGVHSTRADYHVDVSDAVSHPFGTELQTVSNGSPEKKVQKPDTTR
jgi:hypothetical protein